jgi:hypothetical protein
MQVMNACLRIFVKAEMFLYRLKLIPNYIVSLTIDIITVPENHVKYH